MQYCSCVLKTAQHYSDLALKESGNGMKEQNQRNRSTCFLPYIWKSMLEFCKGMGISSEVADNLFSCLYQFGNRSSLNIAISVFVYVGQ